MRAVSMALLVVGLIGCTNSPPTPIVIGHVSDKTRSDKGGLQAELGLRLALHDVTKDGALAETFGGKKVVVQHTDTQGELDAFEAQAVRLFNINRSVAILGGLSAKEVIALDHVKAPILTFHGQPVTGASNNVIYLGISATRQGEVLAKTLAEDRAAQRVAILQDERRTDAAAFVEAFQKEMEKARQDWLGQLPVFTTIGFGKEPTQAAKDAKLSEAAKKEIDWNVIVERVTKPKLDAVVFAGSAQDFNALIRAWRKTKAPMNIKFVHAGADGDHLYDRDADDKLAVLIASAFYADPASEEVQSFLKAFRALPEKMEAGPQAALAYDGLRILVDAMKRTAPQVTPERFREELLKTKDFDGLMGPLTITSERQVQRPVFVLRRQNGTATLVKRF